MLVDVFAKAFNKLGHKMGWWRCGRLLEIVTVEGL